MIVTVVNPADFQEGGTYRETVDEFIYTVDGVDGYWMFSYIVPPNRRLEVPYLDLCVDGADRNEKRRKLREILKGLVWTTESTT